MEPELGRPYDFNEFPQEMMTNEAILRKVPRCLAIAAERLGIRGDPRPLIVHLRWTNKICFECHRKDPKMKFYVCPDCHLAFYCSQQCFDKHQPSHQNECKNPDVLMHQISYGGQLGVVDIRM